MQSVTLLKAAGQSDAGRQRSVNEDRFYADPARGLFVVVDGVGGQAAGGRAADVALATLKTRLAAEGGSAATRIRDALTVANNEIHHLAGTRHEWNGMACVATTLLVEGSRATVGHVGDTRLYKLWCDGIEKVTRDHSPVGEREDAGEISEADAMRHPRRNEVYRDLGSDLHHAADPDFIDIIELPFEPDTAFLLCSDGLTDLIESSTIHAVATRWAGDPAQIAKALVDEANAAGGKDNVTVVYVEGDTFAQSCRDGRGGRPVAPGNTAAAPTSNVERHVRAALVILLTLLLGVSIGGLPEPVRSALLDANTAPPSPAALRQLVVRPGESIGDALKKASPGAEVIVEPGEYREAVSLASHVRLISRVPSGAILRLPASARETDAAAVASGVLGAELVGFRIIGDATTALGTGLLVQDSQITIVDTEISGATEVGIDIGGTSRVDLMASDLHDNPGAAFAVRSGASARIVHNVFKRNGASPQTAAPVILGERAELTLAANMFHDMPPTAFGGLSDADRAALVRDNYFPDTHPVRSAAATRGRGSRR